MSIVLRQQSAPTSQEKLLRILFSLRGLETTQQQQEFLHPTHPSTITVDAVAIDHLQMQRATSIIHDAIQNKKNILERIEKLSYPLFVKPANTGSSIGVSKAKDLILLSKNKNKKL